MATERRTTEALHAESKIIRQAAAVLRKQANDLTVESAELKQRFSNLQNAFRQQRPRQVELQGIEAREN